MKHPLALVVLLVHLAALWAMWKLADSDTAENGNFIGVGLIAGILILGDVAMLTVAAFRWLFL